VTATSVDRVRRSYEQLTPRLRDFTAALYERLFAALPEARPLFAAADMEAQRNHFAAALALIVRNLAVLDALEEPLRALGAAHAQIGVRPHHYPPFCAAMIAALAEVLGDRWAPELAADWRNLLLTVSRHMLAGSLYTTG
jgi:hemoglobin-like flavoprotein